MPGARAERAGGRRRGATKARTVKRQRVAGPEPRFSKWLCAWAARGEAQVGARFDSLRRDLGPEGDLLLRGFTIIWGLTGATRRTAPAQALLLEIRGLLRGLAVELARLRGAKKCELDRDAQLTVLARMYREQADGRGDVNAEMFDRLTSEFLGL